MSKINDTVKISVLAKALGEHPVSIVELAREYGISVSAIYSWIKKSTNSVGSTMKKVTRPKEWSSEARLEVINQTHNMSPEEIGEYCRAKGLYTYNIEEFRRDFITMGTPTLRESQLQKNLKEANEARKKAEAALLAKEKDILKKDSALAEITALLVLKKKADLIWGVIEAAP